MNTRRRVAASAAALATAVGGTALLPTQADAVGTIPTVNVFLGAKGLHMSTTTVHAGRVKFNARTPKGDHELQLLRLHKGYTPAQLGKDVNAGFQGNVAAVKRLDHRVTWLGGAETKPNHPGSYSVYLRPGTYFVVDQNGPGAARLRVVGTPVPRTGITSSSTIIGNIKDRFMAPKAIPHTGWTTFKDTSDEPHFVVFQHVKPNTTRAMVRKALRSNKQPAFALPGSTSAGVVSGSRHIQFHYKLRPGKYVIMCFWPSDENGMPHAFMGMFRFINLQ